MHVRRNARVVAGLAAGFACIADTNPAHSQSASADDSTGLQIEEVVVSARKKQERSQTVPLAMTALDERRLENAHASDLADVSRLLPNVILDPGPGFANGAAFAIRGISFQDPDASFEPAVGVIVDGVFLAKATASLLDLYDVERIEVIRGPQGTLFGKNTIGGIVNVRTRRPTGELGFRAEATAGNYGRADFRGAVDFPVVEDKLAAKVSLLSQNMDGFFRNRFDGSRRGEEDVLAGRATFVFTPGDRFDATLIIDHTRNRGDASPLNNASLPTDRAASIGFPADTDGELFTVNTNGRTFTHSDATGAVLEANLELAHGTLTSVTGYRDLDDDASNDLDGDSIDLLQSPRVQHVEQFSQELRFSGGEPSSRFDYVAGLMYFLQDHEQDRWQILDCTLLGSCPGRTPGEVSVRLESLQKQRTDTYAVFAQGNYHVTPKTRLTLGGRYSYEYKHIDYNPPGFNLAPAGLAPFVSRSAHFERFTPRVGADYRPNDNLMYFASYATGLKAGGFNGRSNNIRSIGPYAEETVDAYEIGLKSDWLERRLRLNATGFFNIYDQLQVEVIVPSTAGSGQETIVSNAGKARTYGLELEMAALPTAQLSLTLSAGYLRAKYTDFAADLTGSGIVTDNSGLGMRRAPRWTTNAGARYEIPAGAGRVTIAADVNYTTEYETSVLNESLARRPAAALVNSTLGYEHAGGRYRVVLFAKNLFDREFIANGVHAGRLIAFNEPNRPREYGVHLGARF